MRNSKDKYTRYITNRGKYVTRLFTYYPYQQEEKEDGQECTKGNYN